MEAFPRPTFQRSNIEENCPILVNDTVSSTRILRSQSGRYFEIGGAIKPAIFGGVFYSVRLDKLPQEELFARTTEEAAIKYYSKNLMRRIRG
jgi:hypothetical protein